MQVVGPRPLFRRAVLCDFCIFLGLGRVGGWGGCNNVLVARFFLSFFLLTRSWTVRHARDATLLAGSKNCRHARDATRLTGSWNFRQRCYACNRFSELQTRSWCYASNRFLELQTRSWCYASNRFLELQTCSWFYASNKFLELQTRSWYYASNRFLELQTRSWCYASNRFLKKFIPSSFPRRLGCHNQMKEHPELKKIVQQFMWRKPLGPCQPSVFLARLGKAAKQIRWNHGRKKGQCRADVVQKKSSFVKFQNPDFHT